MSKHTGPLHNAAVQRIGNMIADEVAADPENLCLMCITKDLFIAAAIATAGNNTSPLALGRFLQHFIADFFDQFGVSFTGALLMTDIQQQEEQTNEVDHKLYS